MAQRWGLLTFMHWSFDPGDVQRLLPDWLTVETFEDRAWVGLVPFFMRAGTSGGRTLPWVSNFCETNVRTYVRDPEGRTGVWFFSLEAARFGAVAVARTTYGLPYFWADMELDLQPEEIFYDSRRRWPGPRGARSTARLALGEEIAPEELGDFEHYLTARWILFSSTQRRHRWARAQHDPWVLRKATVLELDDELIAAAGLPQPSTEPIVHYSEGVDVSIGLPTRYR